MRPSTSFSSTALTSSTVVTANSGNSPDSRVFGSASFSGLSRSAVDHQTTQSPAGTAVRRRDDPISMMEDFEEFISDFLICSEAQRTVLALWILHTYSCSRASFLTPYLNIYSPLEQSGKSVCLGLLRAFCARPWLASGVPASTLIRKILAARPTVLLDNWHTSFRSRDQQPITGFLLHGCQASQPFTLLEKGHLSEADAYCPKAFAGMASLPPALAQRSIPIVLQRPLPQQDVIPVFALLDRRNTLRFTSWAQQWTDNHVDQIYENTVSPQHRKSLGALSPHQQGSAQPLLGLAQTIGGEWPQKARTALLEIFRQEQDRQASALQLLSDVRDAFAHHNRSQRIFTAELLQYLHSLDHRTWHEGSKGQPLNAHALSALLRQSFHIYSRSQRRDDQKRRGYQRADFADAWKRYLPPSNTGHQAEEAPGNAAADETHDESSQPAKGLDSRPLPAGRRSPDYLMNQSPRKSRLVSMSQFKTTWKKRWAKSRSALKRFAGTAARLFVTTRN